MAEFHDSTRAERPCIWGVVHRSRCLASAGCWQLPWRSRCSRAIYFQLPERPGPPRAARPNAPSPDSPDIVPGHSPGSVAILVPRAGPFSLAAGNTWDRNPCLRADSDLPVTHSTLQIDRTTSLESMHSADGAGDGGEESCGCEDDSRLVQALRFGGRDTR